MLNFMKFLIELVFVFTLLSSPSQSLFDKSSLPVVDILDFYSDQKRVKFLEEVSRSLHEFGFFAVINTGIQSDILEAAYIASEKFFKSPISLKLKINDLSSNGQRGLVFSERAQGQTSKDIKEFVHIGHFGNIWPDWMDLENPMMNLLESLDSHRRDIENAISLCLGEDINFLARKTVNSSSLLRALYYPVPAQPEANGALWSAAHTDIDLFTILPFATNDGLQIYYNNSWLDVRVPPDAFIINSGDLLENLSNGYFRSSFHRVVRPSDNDKERFSIVYFIHGYDQCDFSPLPKYIEMNNGVRKFPIATEMDLLSRRLVELGLADKDMLAYDKSSGLIEQVIALTEEGHAAEAVIRMYESWKQQQSVSVSDASSHRHEDSKSVAEL